MSNPDIVELLRQSKVFKGFSDDNLKFVSTCGQRVFFNANDPIIKEGQTGHSLYIVIKGRVEVILPKFREEENASRPTSVRLGCLMKGDCIGEYSLIDQKPASATVVAIDTCEMFEIPRSGFEKIVQSGDNLARHVYENMLRMLISRARKRNRELDLCY